MTPLVYLDAKDLAKLNAEKWCFLRDIPERYASKLEDSFHLCGCWNWVGAKNGKTGYGKVTLHGKQFLAHRIIYELRYGPIPSGMVIHHLCYNRRCCNPFHLAIASYAENTHDSPNVVLFSKDTYTQ